MFTSLVIASFRQVHRIQTYTLLQNTLDIGARDGFQSVEFLMLELRGINSSVNVFLSFYSYVLI